MGKTDKIVRIVLAVLLGLASYTGMVTGVTATVFLVIAAVMVLTSVLSFCPLYAVVGLNTCAKEEKV